MRRLLEKAEVYVKQDHGYWILSKHRYASIQTFNVLTNLGLLRNIAKGYYVVVETADGEILEFNKRGGERQ